MNPPYPLSGPPQFILSGIVIAMIGFYAVLLNKVIGRLKDGEEEKRPVAKSLHNANVLLVGELTVILFRIFMDVILNIRHLLLDQIVVVGFMIVNIMFIVVFFRSYYCGTVRKILFPDSKSPPAKGT